VSNNIRDAYDRKCTSENFLVQQTPEPPGLGVEPLRSAALENFQQDRKSFNHHIKLNMLVIDIKEQF
jgi:hypothetical protein